MRSDLMPDYANPMVDTAFKQMISLDGEGGDCVAVSLINAIVPDFQRDPIKSLRPLHTDFHISKNSDYRALSMDFCGTSERNEQILLELQVKRHIAFDDRALFYLAKTFSSQKNNEELRRTKGIPWYECLKKAYGIQIVGYDTNAATGIASDHIKDDLIARVAGHRMKDSDYMKWFLFTDQLSGQVIDKMQMIQIELPRTKTMNLFPPTKNFDKLHWWLSIFNYSEKYTSEYVEKLDKEGIMPKEVIKGLKRLKYDKWTPVVRKEYLADAEELYKHWDCPSARIIHDEKVKSMTEGMARGKAEGKIEIVRAMLENGMSIDAICKCTGLSGDEVRELIK